MTFIYAFMQYSVSAVD